MEPCSNCTTNTSNHPQERDKRSAGSDQPVAAAGKVGRLCMHCSYAINNDDDTATTEQA